MRRRLVSLRDIKFFFAQRSYQMKTSWNADGNTCKAEGIRHAQSEKGKCKYSHIPQRKERMLCIYSPLGI